MSIARDWVQQFPKVVSLKVKCCGNHPYRAHGGNHWGSLNDICRQCPCLTRYKIDGTPYHPNAEKRNEQQTKPGPRDPASEGAGEESGI